MRIEMFLRSWRIGFEYYTWCSLNTPKIGEPDSGRGYKLMFLCFTLDIKWKTRKQGKPATIPVGILDDVTLC